MIDTIQILIDYGLQQGWPIEILVMLCGFVGLTLSVFWVWNYFAKKNAQIISTMLEISVNLDQQARTLQTTTKAMQNLNDNIKALMKVDERLTEGQCVIVYSLMMDSFFSDLLDAYHSIKRWVNDRHIDHDNDDHRAMIDNKLRLEFQTNIKELEDHMRNFKFNDSYLDKYLNDEFHNEVSHIRVHIYNTIVTDTNEVRVYLERKCNLFKADFNIYLRGDK